jgi:hypothetical protein
VLFSTSHSGNSSSLADGLTPTLNNEPKLTQEASLKQLLQSLMHTERTQSALNMYKNRLLDAIKLIVRTCVMEYLSFFDPSMAYEDNPFDPYGGDSNVSARLCVCCLGCVERGVLCLSGAWCVLRCVRCEVC